MKRLLKTIYSESTDAEVAMKDIPWNEVEERLKKIDSRFNNTIIYNEYWQDEFNEYCKTNTYNGQEITAEFITDELIDSFLNDARSELISFSIFIKNDIAQEMFHNAYQNIILYGSKQQKRTFCNYTEILNSVENKTFPNFKLNINTLLTALKNEAKNQYTAAYNYINENKEQTEENNKRKEEEKQNRNKLKKQIKYTDIDWNELKEELEAWADWIQEDINKIMEQENIEDMDDLPNVLSYEYVDETFVEICSITQQYLPFFTEEEIQDILRPYYDWKWYGFMADDAFEKLQLTTKKELKIEAKQKYNLRKHLKRNRILARMFKNK